jgi:uncharacterized coiled-coil DUF342 family protein
MTVTLETPLPELGKEKLVEPSSDDLRKNLKDVHAEIDANRKKIDKLKEERSKAIDEDRKERAKNQGDLKGLFKGVKELSGQIGDLNDEKKLFEKDMDKLSFEKEGLIKQCYGKKLMKASECNDRIEELNYRQKTEKLTAIEERAILKDLKDLQQSLPIIEKVDEIEKGLKVLRDQKKEIGGRIRKLIDEKNELNKVIDETKEKQIRRMGERNDSHP